MVVEMAPPVEEQRESFDIWWSIQNDKEKNESLPPPYIHPEILRSSSLMSQKSLEICTESLGSETGSEGFSSAEELDKYLSRGDAEEGAEEEGDEEDDETEYTEMATSELCCVNSQGSIRRSLVGSFPPPLPSLSCRENPCLRMMPYRCHGRLFIDAVVVPSYNYLQAERHGDRLQLSFVDTCYNSKTPVSFASIGQQWVVGEEGDEGEDTDVEEEVEVVDRGNIVEVKVSTQPQTSGATASRVHRSSIVINKFVIGYPLNAAADDDPNQLKPTPPTVQNPHPGSLTTPPLPEMPVSAAKRANLSMTTAASAVLAASSISTPVSTTEGFRYNYLNISKWGPQSPAAAAAADAKLLFASSRRRNREELLHDMRRCNDLRRPLFIFEQPYCITSSSS